MKERQIKLILAVFIGLLAVGGLAWGLLNPAEATTGSPNYDIVLPGQQDAPLLQYGRPAPYGQFIVTHNSVTFSATQNCGTVARTNGYAPSKAIFCDVGAEMITATLWGRITSTGGGYTLSIDTEFPEATNTYSSFTDIAPWMSLCVTGTYTTCVGTCGIFVQTP